MAVKSRTGRPAGASDKREKILTAAREEFAEHGFRAAPLRAIAARAGVDVALISHYFGSKEGLFAATMELPDRARGILIGAFQGERASLGERLTRGYLSLWEDPETGPRMQLLARSALGNETAGAQLRELMTGTLREGSVAPLIEGREADFALAMSTLMGISINRYLTGHPGFADLDFDTLIDRVAPAVQLLLS